MPGDPDVKMAALSRSLPRDSRLLAMIGLTCFRASFALFHFIVPLRDVIGAAFEPALSGVAAALVSGVAPSCGARLKNSSQASLRS